MKKRGNSNVFLHEIFSFTFRERSVAGSERLRKKLKMTTFQDIMRIIRSSNSFNITFSFSNVTIILQKSFAEITQRPVNCSQFLHRGVLFYFLVQFSSQFSPEFR